MKTKTFEIPQDQILDFSVKLIESGLDNQLIEADSDCETVTIEVTYDTSERSSFYELTEWYEDNIETSDE